MRPSEMRMSPVTRPSGRTSVPPRTIVSTTMREFQLVQKRESRVQRGCHVIIAHVLSRMMADTALAAKEQHADGHLLGKHHSIMAGTARYAMRSRARLLERAIEHRGDRWIHCD